MRPISLVIEGYTSFRERQTLDFSELGLFVITGPTGAGKTSILDAMTLALYGRVPRVGLHGVRGFISRGAESCVVSLEFSVSDRRYRVARTYRTTSNQVKAVLERLADDGDAGELVTPLASGQSTVTDRITQLLGMDYDTFLRCILLPQGQFEQFLRGEARDRRAILVHLLGLQRYERARELARRRMDELSWELAGDTKRLETLEGATDEAVRTWSEHIKGLEKRGMRITAALAKARADEIKAREAGGRATSLETLAGEWIHAEAAARRIQRERDEALPQETAAKTELAEAERAVEQATRALAAARAHREQVISEVGGEAAHALIAEHLKARDDAAEKLPILVQELERTAAELEGARRDVATARAESEKAEAEETTRHNAADEAVMALSEANKVLASTEQWEEAEEELDRLTGQLARARAERDVAAARLLGLEAERDQAVAAHGHLSTEHLALSIRATLSTDAACPVCTQMVTRLPEEGDDAATLHGLDECVADVKRLEGDLHEARTEATRYEWALAGVASRYDDAVGRLEALGGTLPLAVARQRQKAAAATAATAEEEHSKATAGVRSSIKKDREAQTACGNAETAHTLAEAKQHQETERGEKALRELESLLVSPLPDDVAGELAQRKQRLVAATASVKTAETDETSAQTRRESARRTADAHVKARTRRDRELGDLCASAREKNRLLLENLTQAGADAPAAIDWPADIDALEGSFGELLAERAVLARTIAAAERTHAETLERGIGDACEALGLARTEGGGGCERLQKLALTVAAEHGAAKAELTTLEGAVKERAVLEEVVANKRRILGDLEWVERQLYQDRFPQYVLAESFQELCDIANVRLEGMTLGRYSLRAHKDGKFEVIDHANADEPRDVTTLSGGETFQASLALALALSELLTNVGGGVELEAIFIDEGFASLDAESLDLALEALEQIEADGERMVGIISHVPSIPERLLDGIEVIKGSRASSIRTREGSSTGHIAAA